MESHYSVFRGTDLVAQGTLTEVLARAHGAEDARTGGLLFFEHAQGRQTDFDLSGTLEEALARLAPRTGPGRPKLGVVSTEVTLLPRHWEWLNAQPGRASGTLRRLVEAAMAAEEGLEQTRLRALGKILWSVAGNEPDFEEASRALFAGDRPRLNALAARWSGNLPEFVASWT